MQRSRQVREEYLGGCLPLADTAYNFLGGAYDKEICK